MNLIISFVLFIVLINCQSNANFDDLTNRLKKSNQQLQKTNNFLQALSETIRKMHQGVEYAYSYVQPVLNVVKLICDSLSYIFSTDHIITVLLIIIFLVFLLKEEEQNNQNHNDIRNPQHLEEQGERILQPL